MPPGGIVVTMIYWHVYILLYYGRELAVVDPESEVWERRLKDLTGWDD